MSDPPAVAAATPPSRSWAARRGAELGSEVRRRAGTEPSPDQLRTALLEVLSANGYAPRDTDDGLRFASAPTTRSSPTIGR